MMVLFPEMGEKEVVAANTRTVKGGDAVKADLSQCFPCLLEQLFSGLQ